MARRVIPYFSQGFCRILKSPAVYTLWLIAFIAFSSLSRIADEMTVISFFGFISNAAGAVLFRLACGGERENDAQ